MAADPDVLEGREASSPPPGPRRAPGSIGRRVTLAVMGVTVLTLLVVGVLFYGFLGRYVIENQKQDLQDQAQVVAEQIAGVGETFNNMPMMRGPRALLNILRVYREALPPGGAIAVYAAGDPVAVAGPPWAQDPGTLARLYAEAEPLIAEEDSGVADLPAQGENQRLIVAAARTDVPELGAGAAVLALPASDAVSGRTGLVRVLLLSALIGLALAAVVGLGLGAWLSRPLRDLGGAARRMAAGSYAEPVTGEYTGELYDLASSMETMRREVRRSEQSLRAFVASAAHELRTPLTSITGFSQALLDGTAATGEARQRASAAIYREAERLRRLVDALLTLSRYDSREFSPHLEPVPLRDLVAEEAERLVEAGIAPEGRIEVSGESGVRPLTDPDMLRQVVANLLKNAVLYGADAPVQADVSADDGSAVLDVTNQGAPLRAPERDRVFERFYRGDAARATEGFGLGLPLVKEIVEVLGGTVGVWPEGPGTTFRVTLPTESEGRSAMSNSSPGESPGPSPGAAPGSAPGGR